MARVEIASMPWGVLQDRHGESQNGTSATLKNLDGSNATTWSAITGGSSSTSSLTADSNGNLPRFVEGGQYTLDVPALGVSGRRVEAVSGSVESGSPSYFNVTAAPYNATGLGIVDDTAAIQTAIDAANTAGGGVVLLPRATNFKVGTLVPKSNVTISGYGATLTKDSTLSSNGIIANIVAQVAVSNFNVFGVRLIGEGQDTGTTSERRSAINIYGGTNIRIRDCYASGFSYQGFAIIGAQRVWIEDNELVDMCLDGAGNAIHIGIATSAFIASPQLSNSIVIRGNRVKNCRTAPVCIQCSYDTTIPATYLSYDVVIADNPFLESVGGASTGFACIALETGRIAGVGTTSQGSRIRRVHVHHNVCHYTGPITNAWGISISDNNGGATQSTDADEMADITVDHNLIDSTGSGILCQASRASIDHNVLTLATAAGIGIYASGNGNASHIPTRPVIDTNIIKLPADGGAGIFVTGIDRPTVKDNEVRYATGSVSSTQPGIRVSSSSNPRVMRNAVENSPRAGVHVDLNTNLRCVGNDVFRPNENVTAGQTGSGIYHVPAASLTGRDVVKDNACIDDRGTPKMYFGIFFNNANSARLAVGGNTVYGGTGGAIGWNAEPLWLGGDQTDAGSYPAYPGSITVTASPFTYTNSHPYSVVVSVVGGTVSSIVKQRVNNTHQVTVSGTAGEFWLDSGDQLIVTYTVAPTMNYWPVKV